MWALLNVISIEFLVRCAQWCRTAIGCSVLGVWLSGWPGEATGGELAGGEVVRALPVPYLFG